MEAHNHSLHGATASHAASIANAILRRSGDEGMALATASKLAHRDDGGMVPAAPAPTPGLQPNNANAGPLAQNYISRFSQMSPEQLQELLPRLGNSPMAAIAQHVLQQKRMMPQQGATPAQAPQQAMPQAGVPPQAARGGQIMRAPPIFHARVGMTPRHFAAGGMSPAVTSYLAGNGENAAPGSTQTGTGINASTGVGVSNTGNVALDNYLNSTEAGAYFGKPPGPATPTPAAASAIGASTPAGEPASGGNSDEIQSVYAPPGPSGNARGGGLGHYARGGMAPHDPEPGHVPILAAGGEFVVSPEHVARLGDGDVKEGHRRLDAFVVRKRKEVIDKMKSLKGPVRS